MIRMEWKKLIHQRAFCALFCLFLLAGMANIFLCYVMPDASGNRPGDYEMALQAYEGASPEMVVEDTARRIWELSLCQSMELAAQLPPDMAESYLDSLLSQSGRSKEDLSDLKRLELLRFSDDFSQEISLLEFVQAQAQRILDYPEYLTSIPEREKSIQSSILYQNNAYVLVLAEKTTACYAQLSRLTLPMVSPIAGMLALGNGLDRLIGVMVVCTAAIFLFLQEREEGMTLLLFSTKRGRTPTYWGKMGLIALMGAGVCLFLFLLRLGISHVWEIWNCPVQILPEFYSAPYRISLGQMLLLSCVQQMAATILVGILMGLLCTGMERSLALGVGAIFAGAEFFCWKEIDSVSAAQPLKYLSVPALFSSEALMGDAIFVKLAGWPVAFSVLAPVFLLVLGSVALALGKQCYLREGRRLSIPSPQRKPRLKKKNPSLFRLELRKLLVHQQGILLLTMLVFLLPLFYRTFYTDHSPAEMRYQAKILSIEGGYSPQVSESLTEELVELQSFRDSSDNPLIREELDNRISALNRVLELIGYLATCEGPICYVYEGGYEAMLGIRAVGVRFEPALIAIALSLLLPGLFAFEQESGMNGLCQTTSSIQKLHRIKWLIGILISAFVFFICWLPETVYICRSFPMGQWNAPAVSIPSLASYPRWMPLWGAVAWNWLGRLGFSLSAGAVALFWGKKLGKYLPAVVASAVCLLIVVVLW